MEAEVVPASDQSVSKESAMTIRVVATQTLAFSPASARAAINKRRMSMQDSIDVTKIDRQMYNDRFNCSRPPKIVIENQDGEIQPPESVRSETPDHPVLEFSLRYDADASLLHVSIDRSTNLHPLTHELNEHFTTINPFCKVQLTPCSAAKSLKQSRAGKVLKNMWAPVFAEQFALSIDKSELETRTLQICIYHSDGSSAGRHVGASDVCLGHVLLPLANVKLLQRLEMRKDIEAGEVKSAQQPPMILLGIAYLPTAERLTIHVSKVTNLLNPSTKSVQILITVIGEANAQLGRKRTSAVKVSAQNAEVKETLAFNLRKRPIDMLLVRVTVLQFSGSSIFRKRLDEAALEFGSDVTNATGFTNQDASQHWQDMLTGHDTQNPRWHTMIAKEASDLKN